MNDDIVVRYEAAGEMAQTSLVLIFEFDMTCEDWVELGYVNPFQRLELTQGEPT